jgi:hypothetical protein
MVETPDDTGIEYARIRAGDCRRVLGSKIEAKVP